jgi:hypothetical protein
MPDQMRYYIKHFQTTRERAQTLTKGAQQHGDPSSDKSIPNPPIATTFVILGKVVAKSTTLDNPKLLF